MSTHELTGEVDALASAIAILASLSHPSITEDFRNQLEALAAANATENRFKAAIFDLIASRVQASTQ